MISKLPGSRFRNPRCDSRPNLQLTIIRRSGRKTRNYSNDIEIEHHKQRNSSRDSSDHDPGHISLTLEFFIIGLYESVLVILNRIIEKTSAVGIGN